MPTHASNGAVAILIVRWPRCGLMRARTGAAVGVDAAGWAVGVAAAVAVTYGRLLVGRATVADWAPCGRLRLSRALPLAHGPQLCAGVAALPAHRTRCAQELARTSRHGRVAMPRRSDHVAGIERLWPTCPSRLHACAAACGRRHAAGAAHKDNCHRRQDWLASGSGVCGRCETPLNDAASCAIARQRTCLAPLLRLQRQPQHRPRSPSLPPAIASALPLGADLRGNTPTPSPAVQPAWCRRGGTAVAPACKHR